MRILFGSRRLRYLGVFMVGDKLPAAVIWCLGIRCALMLIVVGPAFGSGDTAGVRRGGFGFVAAPTGGAHEMSSRAS